ncbi:MAG: YfiR family protein [Salinivirgaceae bacterium]
MLKFIHISIFVLFLPFTSANQIDEVTLKAVYIERFTRFIEWPYEIEKADFFRIQVVGSKEMAEQFREVFKQLPIKNKSVLVFDGNAYDANFGTHLIYVSDKYYLDKILENSHGKPILIVTEGRGGAESGAMINIYRKNQKLRFEINEQAIHESLLYVSYRLLQSAENIVNPMRTNK